MSQLIELREKNLSRLPVEVKTPSYDRSEVKEGIVHIGVGNFHRAHQAFYTDQILDKEYQWGICGVGLLEGDQKMFDILQQQDGLYTLIIKKPDGKQEFRIIGAIVNFLYAPGDRQAVIDKMADPDTKIISLTITEGGYNYRATSEEFIVNTPEIQWDINHSDQPVTVFGFLSRAFRNRKDKNHPGLTILSCDNLQKNGDICRKMFLSFLKEADPELVDWVNKNISFPNSMVDRITPSTSSNDILNIHKKLNISDQWPVPAEPFIQWIVEDNFISGRPPWESAGVQFVEDVRPYEKMKIRLLNAGHTLLGLSGTICEYQTVDEAVRDPILLEYFKLFMDLEVTPVLDKVEGIDIEDYKKNLINRFSNPYISDSLFRICSESSAKIPKFVVPTIIDQLERNGPIKLGTLIIASWCLYLTLPDNNSYKFEIQDIMQDELKQKAKNSFGSDPRSFLTIRQVFGNLIESDRFCNTFEKMISDLRTKSIKEVIQKVLKGD